MAGNIKIIEPTSNFQKVSKGIIFNPEIDPFTLGIYVKVIALGKRWELNLGRFAEMMKMSEDRIRKAFAKLETAGYLRRERSRNDKNQFIGWNYQISTEPFPDMGVSRPSENPDVGDSRPSENREVYNRDIKENRDINKNNEDNTLYRTSGRFVIPSLDEVAQYCRMRGNTIDPQQFIDHYTANGWRVGNVQMRDWRAAVRTWEARRKNEAPRPQAPAPRPYLSPEERTMQALARLQARDGSLQTFNTPEEQ